MLHADDPVMALVRDMPEDVAVVDLTGSRFVAAGVVAVLEASDVRPALVEIRDQVSFGDLLVIDVEQDLARRAVHRFADCIRLR